MEKSNRRLSFRRFRWKYYFSPSKFNNLDKIITIQDEIRLRRNGEPPSATYAEYSLDMLEDLRLKISVVSRKVTYEKRLKDEDWDILDNFTASFIRHYIKHSKNKPWF